ncbi:hypothetical protein B0J17DRAFT_721338 [Rhizoctonia solani]|nr:hypothetical protein B0J17DRAFT_721338 [Rhizoctonia solani]
MALLNLRKETHGMDKQQQTQHCQGSKKKSWLHLVLEELLKLEPAIIQCLLMAPPDYCRTINQDTAKSLSKGQSNGWSEDMWKMAKLMNDEVCISAFPSDLDWDNPQSKADFLSGKIWLLSQQWPCLCWMACQYNPAKPSEGLLYRDLLTEGGKGILLLLSSINNITGAPGAWGSRGKCKNHKGLAKHYKINKITTLFIAYVVVQHALTSDKVFDKTCDGFNYPAFYNGIKEYLDAPSFKSCATALLDWWNQ